MKDSGYSRRQLDRLAQDRNAWLNHVGGLWPWRSNEHFYWLVGRSVGFLDSTSEQDHPHLSHSADTQSSQNGNSLTDLSKTPFLPSDMQQIDSAEGHSSRPILSRNQFRRRPKTQLFQAAYPTSITSPSKSSNGPMTDPCGTPLLTSVHDDTSIPFNDYSHLPTDQKSHPVSEIS